MATSGTFEDSGELRIWERESGRLIDAIESADDPGGFVHDGSQFLHALRDGVWLYDRATGRALSGGIYGATWSRGGLAQHFTPLMKRAGTQLLIISQGGMLRGIRILSRGGGPPAWVPDFAEAVAGYAKGGVLRELGSYGLAKQQAVVEAGTQPMQSACTSE